MLVRSGDKILIIPYWGKRKGKITEVEVTGDNKGPFDVDKYGWVLIKSGVDGCFTLNSRYIVRSQIQLTFDL